MKKRQEIGRGLRLPLNVSGERIFDSDINILTVVANESYQEYASALQKEFNEAGYTDTPETMDAKEKRVLVKADSKNLESQDFKSLWERISARTRYNIELKANLLISQAVEEINKRDISNLVVTVDKVTIDFGEDGEVKTIYAGSPVAGARIKRDIRIGNVVDRVARETGITRETILEIFSRVDNLDLLFGNPEEYIRSVIVVVRGVLNDLLINDGLKYIPTGDSWEVDLLFTDFEVLQRKSIEGGEKSAFDRVPYDSDGERKFAESLIASPNVKLFTKLPRGFRVDTPLGAYIPDWAIVWSPNPTQAGGEKLYLVRETKFGYKDWKKELSQAELQKIFCGRRHFAAIKADFDIAEQVDLSDLRKR